MAIQESGEMYLETILILSQSSNYVRAINISEYMNYSKPSVSRGLAVLKKEGYVMVSDLGAVNLTEKGRNLAEKIYEKHTILTKFLISLGVNPVIASNDACKMEHVISDQSFLAIKNSIKNNNA